jgi:hypothetical protein
MLFRRLTLAPNASAVSKPAIKSKLEIGGLDTPLEEHSRLLDHRLY